MNTLRTMSRFSVAMIVILLAGNAHAFDLNSIVHPIVKIASDKDVKNIGLSAAGIAGGAVLKDLLDKESALVVAGLAGLFANAMDDSKAGVVAAGTSLAISVVTAHTPEIAAVEVAKDKLPKCLTSKEAKMAAQIAASVAIAHYLTGTNNNG